MNKIFKIIWNHSTQTFTVVSELARSCGKSKSLTDKRVLPIAVAVAMAGVAAPEAQAAAYSEEHLNHHSLRVGSGSSVTNAGSTSVNQHATAVGINAKAASQSVALGSAAHATSGHTIAIGYGTQAKASESTAVGHAAVATGTWASAFGGVANSAGQASTAIGFRSEATKDFSATLGAYSKATAGHAVAVGSNSTASGQDAVAVGGAATASGTHASAFGANSQATEEKAVALGKEAKALAEKATALGFGSEATASRATAVGQSSNASGVASFAGGANATSGGTESVAVGQSANSAGNVAVAVGKNSSASGAWSLALGGAANSTGQNAVAVGGGAKSLADNAAAFGPNSNASGVESFAAGSNANASGAQSVAIGKGATATHANSVALGNGSTTAAGVNTSKAEINGLTYTGFEGETTRGVVSIGSAGNERQLKNVAAGQITAGSTDAINGSQLYQVIRQAHWKVRAENTTGGTASGKKDQVVHFGDTVKFIAGNGLNIAQNNHNFTISVNTAALTPNNSGAINTPSNNDAGKLVNASTVANAINQSGHKVASADTDEALATSTVNANGALVKPGDKQTFTAGKNLEVKQSGANLTFALANDINVNTVNATTINVPTGGNNKVVINNNGINAGNKKITNVANGTNAKDAVNLSQLNATKVDVAAGSNIVAVTPSANRTTGGTTYTVHAKGAEVATSGGFITVANSTVANNVTRHTLSVNTQTISSTPSTTGTINRPQTDGLATVQNVVDVVNNVSWRVTSGKTTGENTGKAEEKVKAGDLVEFIAGDNVKIVQAGKKFTISAKQAGASTTDLTVDGNGNVTAPADGSKLVNATTVIKAINDSGYKVASKDTEEQLASSTANDTGVLVTPGDKQTFTAAKNLEVKQEGANITFGLSKDITVNSTTTNSLSVPTGGVVINAAGINAGNKKISNVANGTDNNDAVNISQLKANTTKVVKGSNIADVTKTSSADGITYTVHANGSAVAAKDNLVTVTSNTGTNNVTTYTVGVTTGTIADAGNDGKLTNPTSNGLATVTNIVTAVNSVSWALQEKGNTKNSVKAGDKVDFVDGLGTTISITGNEDKSTVKYDIKLADSSLKVDNNGLSANTTTLTPKAEGNITVPTGAEAGKLVNATTVANAINESGHKVATADDDEQVTSGANANGELIKAGEKVIYKAGKNLAVKQDGKTIAFGLTENITVNTVNATTINVPTDGNNKVIINNEGINAGNKPITNVSNGTNLTDAVNISQLKANTTAVVAGTNIAGVEKTESTDGITYKVNAKGAEVVSDNNSFITVANSDAGNNVTRYTLGVTTKEISTTPTDTGTITRPTDNGLATVQNVADVVNNVSWRIVSGATAQGQNTGSNTELVKAGDLVEFIAGENVKIDQEGKKFTISAKQPNASTTDLTVDNDGNVTTNPTDGSKLVNATTVIKAINDSGYKVASKDTDEELASSTANEDGVLLTTGDKQTFTAGKNLEVKQDGANITFALSKDIIVNSTTTNSLSVPTGGVVINADGINAGNKKISNVANGTDNNDAVNISQLKANTTKVVKGTNVAGVEKIEETADGITYQINADGTNVTAAQGSFVTVNKGTKDATTNVTTYTVDITKGEVEANTATGAVTLKNGTTDGVATAQNVANAIAGSGWKLTGPENKETVVNPGDSVNFIDGTGTKVVIDTTNQNAPTVKVDIQTATVETDPNNEGKVSVKTGDKGENLVNATTVAEAINSVGHKVATATDNSQVTSSVNAAGELIKAGETVTYKAGKNLEVNQTGKTIAFGLAENIDVGTVNATTINVPTGGTNKVTINADGINAGNKAISNVADGVNDNDAVNISQLKANTTKVEAGSNIAAVSKTNDANGITYTVHANGSKVAAKDGLVTVEEGQKDTNNVTTYTVGVTTGSIADATNGKLTNPAQDGLATVNNVVSAVNSVSWALHNTAGKVDDVKAGDSVKFIAGNSGLTTVTVANTGDTANTITVDINKGNFGTLPTVANPSATNTGALLAVGNGNVNSQDGVASVTDVITAVNSAFWRVKLDGNGGTEEAVKAGELVEFAAGDNVKIVQAGKKFTISATQADISTSDLTITDGKVADPADGNKLVNATTVAKAINNVSHKVATDSDDVQVTESKNTTGVDIKAGDKLTYKAGKNLVVNQNDKTIAFGLSENIDVGTVNATTINVPTSAGNKVTINADGINAGNKPITNVANGTNANDAVNVSQLNATKVDVAAGSNIAAVTSAPNTTTGGTTYTVHAKGSKVEPATGNAFVTVKPTEDTSTNVTTYTVGVTTGTITETTSGSLTEPTTDGLATVKNVAKAINSVSWELHNGTGKVDDVKAGDKVKLVAGNSRLTTVTVTPDTATNTNTITVDVNKGNFGAMPTTTNLGGTNTGALLAVGNGNANSQDGVASVTDVITAVNSAFWRVKSSEDGGENTTGSEQAVKAGELVEFAAGDNVKIVQAGKKFTISAKQADISTSDLTITDGKVADPADGNKLVNATTVAKAINNVSHKVATDSDDVQVTESKNTTGVDIKAGDKLIYKAGKNLVVNQTDKTIAFGLSENIDVGRVNATTINVPTGGNNKVVIDGNGISAGDKAISNVADGVNNHDAVNISQLKANTTTVVKGSNIAGIEKTADANGITYKVNADGTKVEAAANSLVTVTAGQKDANNVTTYTVDLQKGNLTANTTTGKVTSTDTAEDKAATTKQVADAIAGSGWKLNGNDGTKDVSTIVNPGDNVTFEGEGAAKVTTEVSADGNSSTIKVSVDGKAITDAAKGSITVEGNKAKTDDADDDKLATTTDVVNAINESGHKVATADTDEAFDDSTLNKDGVLVKPGDKQTFTAGKNLEVKQDGANMTFALSKNINVNSVTVETADKDDANKKGSPITMVSIPGLKNTLSFIAPEKDENGKIVGTAPVTIKNINGNLEPTYNTGDIHIIGGRPSDRDVNKPTIEQNAPSKDTIASMYNNAATVGDVLNAGWNLRGNGKPADFVKPYDSVNFVDGEGTTAVVESVDGKANNVTFNVDKGEVTATDQGNVTGPVSKELIDKLEAAQKAKEQLPDTATKEQKEAADKAVKDAQKAVDKATNQVATAKNVADAINNSGHKVATKDTDEELATSTVNDAGTLVKPGTKQIFTAGKNLEVKQDGANITFALSKDISVNSTTTNTLTVPVDGGNITINKDGINAGDKNISNVADGTEDHHAVNVKQLKAAKSSVEKGTNIAGIETKTNADGSTTYVVHADGTKVEAAAGSLVTVTAGAKDATTNVTTYTVDLKKGHLTVDEDTGVADSTDATDKVATTKQVADAINASGWKLSGKDIDDKAITTIVNPGEQVTFEGEDAAKVITTVDNKTGNTTIKVKVDGKAITDAAKGDITVTDGVANTTDAKDDKLATTTDVVNAINNSGHKVATNDTNDAIETSETNAAGVLVKPGTKQTFTAGKNLKVKQEGANIAFALANDIEVNKVTTTELKAGPVTINNDGIDVGDKNISNVADGTEDHHAVNVKQLKAAKSSVEKGTNIAGIETKTNTDGSTTYVVHADGTKVEAAVGSLVTVKAGVKDPTTNVTTYTIDLQKGNLTADKTTGKVTSTDTAEDKVATTKQVADAIANSGWKLAGKDENGADVSTIVNPGESVVFEGEGAAKVITKVDADGNTTIKVKVDGKAITDSAKGDITVTDGVANTTDAKDDKLATTTDVVNAINNSGHKVATNDTNDAIETSETNATGVLVKPGDKQTFTAGKNLKVKQDGANVTFAVSNDLDVDSVKVGEPGKDGKPGKDGTVAVNGKDGSSVVINGKDGSIGLTGPKGKDGKDGVSANIKIGVGEPGVDGKDGVPGLEGADGKPQKPRMEYTYDNNGTKVTEKVATLKDGLIFDGDVGEEVKRPLNSKLTVKGGQKDRKKLADKANVGVVSDPETNSLEVKLAKEIDLTNEGSVTIGDTVVNDNGVTIKNGPSIHKSGINAGNRTINNVKEGVKGTDAVNVNQLNRKVGDVHNRINKVNKDLQAGVAGATAMAFLQRPNLPGKSMVSAAVGGYKGQSAVAVGYARNSDNNKVSIKLGVGLNTRKDVTYGGSVGYQW